MAQIFIKLLFAVSLFFVWIFLMRDADRPFLLTGHADVNLVMPVTTVLSLYDVQAEGQL